MTSFQRIVVPRRRLADEVYQQILRAISSGSISPADRLVQEKLASDFQISRTPVREALLRLEQEGVLLTTGRGGFAIRQLTDQEVREIYQAREAVEGHSASVLAKRRDKAAYDRIQAVIDAKEHSRVSAAAEYYESNKAIHRAFVEEVGNRYLLDMFDSMWNRAISFHVFTTTMSEEELKESLREHSALCDAVRTGDADFASNTMRTHINDGLELQLRALAATREKPKRRTRGRRESRAA